MPKYQSQEIWNNLLADLPDIDSIHCVLTEDHIQIGSKQDLSESQHKQLFQRVEKLKNWRKGPFNLFGTVIDTEWRSDLKWNRMTPHLPDLTNKRILDIGANSGYYMFRMAAHQPAFVLGVDPTYQFYTQFRLLNHFAKLPMLNYLPIKFEELPNQEPFDVIFCMGILYHHRHPLMLLKDLKHRLNKGGYLILETLILEGDTSICLCPVNTYAKMKNVFYIPTVSVMEAWLRRSGFQSINRIDTTWTTPEEQRSTPFSDGESLSAFLNPSNPKQTIEGYPAPLRASWVVQ